MREQQVIRNALIAIIGAYALLIGIFAVRTKHYGLIAGVPCAAVVVLGIRKIFLGKVSTTKKRWYHRLNPAEMLPS